MSQSATLNVSLHPGAVQQTVNVAANTEAINTTSAEISTEVNANAVVQLPLNGRDPSSLVFLAAGATNVKNEAGTYITGPVFPTETGASVNGGRQGSVFYLLDGVSNMDDYNMLTAPFPNADATQEFRIISNNFDARYGFAPTAVVTVETKSGSNKFHGGIFEFLRNQDFNAKNWFSHVVDPLRRNQFGGGVGGPALRDRLFFFVNYQGTRASSATSGNVIYTPTAAMLNGDFSGIPQTLKAPFSTIGGKPNQIDPALFNPASVAIAKTALPQGQAANGAVSYTSAPTVNNFDEVTDRVDYVISEKQRVMVRTYINYFVEPQSATKGNILSVVNGQKDEDYNAALSHTWTINPSTINIFSPFWTQLSGHTHAESPDINGQDFCWHRYINVSDAPFTGGQCFVSGFSVNSAFSTASFNPAQEIRTTIGLYDTFIKNIRRHSISAGTNLQHENAVNIGAFPGNAGLTFNGSYTGLGLADFLLGDLYGFSQGAGQIADTSGYRLGFFGQDAFRFRPNITVTAGLRWDPNTPPSSPGGRGDGFNPGQQSTVFPNAPVGLIFPGDKGLNSGLMPTTYGYWEPRLGVAWQPRGLPRTSVRAAFGLFTSPLLYVMYNHMALSAPFSPTYTFNGTPGSPLNFSNPYASYPGTGGQNPFPPFVSVAVPPPEHGIYIDYKGHVWIGGSGNEDQILKLTRDGKCVLQIGHGGHKKTNADTENVWKATDVFVYPKTNELFVSDGYGNRRIIVFDADTGKFKRMWGAFGNQSEDSSGSTGQEGSSGAGNSGPQSESRRIPAKNLPANDPGPPQFETVHGVKVSHDGLVYVADRGGKRVQVFTTDGHYLNQIFVDRWCESPGGSNLFCGNGQTAASVAFSADPAQRFLYVASRSPGRILVFDRRTLAPLTAIGRPGVEPGAFYVLHQMTTDSTGNLYTAEVEDGRRVQRFVFKGVSPSSRK